ncbi:intramembrane protease [Stachybotrys elegans]|uniref:Intramembrane protease n=1 Tax=Stachybotrys elegans TaxID=80388 RepID=A0A8K0SPK0_9HYPO|nr:intramembrane protease [Stachybotrys elegans]
MAETQPSDVLANGGLDGLDTSPALNQTSSTIPTAWDFMGDVSFFFLEVQLILGAMSIIYFAAHASLRRPPSAAPRKSKKPGQKHIDETQFAQGLEPSDAIMFPLLAGALLIGLYYIIQWLKDPALLNKILKYYMSFMSVASLFSLYAHGIQLAVSFVFPDYWRGRDGRLRKVDQRQRVVVICDNAGNPQPAASTESNPLPGALSLFGATPRLQKSAWEIRSLLTRHWALRFAMHGVGEEKANIKFSHMVGMFMGLATALLYFTTSMTFLSNVLGYGMCYGSLQLLSPTNFLTGALVLVGLFFYDIVMVFYTPYMVTVATTLDVPIKLTFKAAGRQSILGLGDIVIPGIVIAWTLRLDLWVHYLRKVKYDQTALKLIEKDSTGTVVERMDYRHREIKTQYQDVKGNWGNSLWIRGPLFISGAQQAPPSVAAARFSKVYFTASMVGYLLGMLVTLAMLLVFKRGQPALLYLVPGVLGSILVTAAARGELKELWTYTEDDSLDTVDVVVDLDANGRPIKTVGKLENGVVDTTKTEDDKNAKSEEEKKQEDKKEKEGKDQIAKGKGHQVFLLALDAPPEGEDED